ncbi:MAG TPA: fructose-6-phosphate aldolase [Phycisphaerae bacterium]|nr:fructose-6-phosphate aldolase [Phycisphaerae bacterium]
MKFFIDTANLDQIRKYRDMHLVDGVTTNPSLAAKENTDFRSLIKTICGLVQAPVSAEVVSTRADEMFAEARELAAISPHVVVKLPTIPEGIKALARCVEAGIPTNMTLVFQPLQALIVAKIGATYVSPFLGRLDDIGQDSMDVLSVIREIYDNYDFQTKILAASLRHPLHVVQAARLGADVATLPPTVFDKLLDHPLTTIGLERFLADWGKMRPEA